MSEKQKRQKAVAIQYKPEEHAPKVVAKGAGVIAEKIMEKAEDTDIAVYQDAKLVDELSRMDLGQHIPPELYEVVAQVLIFINDLDSSAGKRQEPSGPAAEHTSLEQQLDLSRLKPMTPEHIE